MKSAVVGLLALLSLAAVPASAGVRNCTSALVTGGICNAASDGLLFFSMSTVDPDGAGPRVAPATQVQEGCALMYQYQATINGSPNSETRAQFCERALRQILFKAFQDFYYRAQADAVGAAAFALTPSDTVP